MEIWKHITGLPSGYEISSYGNARIDYIDYTEPLSAKMTTDGYQILHIMGKSYKIHHLVASAFLENPDNKPIVRHKDNNKQNNHVDNLEWINYADLSKTVYTKGKNRAKAVICVETGRKYATLSSAALHLGLPVSAIDASATDQVACFGYHFEFIDATDNDESLIFISNREMLKLGQTMSSIEEFRAMFDK